jgi:Cys-tRNA(Pro)/Cys-tRNA(Cys) deacylase
LVPFADHIADWIEMVYTGGMTEQRNDPYEEKFIAYLAANRIKAQHLTFQQSCHSVAEAAQAVNATAEDFVKNICLIDKQGDLILAIVKGEDRVSAGRVAQVLGIPTPRLANPAEILEKTGYPCGGTPSFGFPATVLIDERVMERDDVYTGGGSEMALMKISPRELLRASHGRVVCIHK